MLVSRSRFRRLLRLYIDVLALAGLLGAVGGLFDSIYELLGDLCLGVLSDLGDLRRDL